MPKVTGKVIANKFFIFLGKNSIQNVYFFKEELQLREQLQFLKESCNINEHKIMCIHALNMSGI
jgi:hypothetical protein